MGLSKILFLTFIIIKCLTFFDFFHRLWGFIWTRRSIMNPQRKQNVWWVGAESSAWWIFSEQYFWRFIHWRGNGVNKGYIWRRVQVCSLWVKEEIRQHSFSRPGSDWREIVEQAITGNLWEILCKKWMRILWTCSSPRRPLFLHVLSF